MSRPAAPGFGAEAGRPCADFQGQGIGVKSFVAMQAGKFHFGGRRKPQVSALHVKHFRREFRQLAHAGQRSGIHQKRRKDFRVAVLARVHVEEKIGEGAFEPRAQPLVDGKARAGNFDGGGKIQDSGSLADFPVRPRLEFEFGRRAPAADFHIIGGGFSHRDARVRNIRHHQQEILQLFIERGDLLIFALNGL